MGNKKIIDGKNFLITSSRRDYFEYDRRFYVKVVINSVVILIYRYCAYIRVFRMCLGYTYSKSYGYKQLVGIKLIIDDIIMI